MSDAMIQNATRQGDVATVMTLLSTSDALSFINYQGRQQIISSDTFAAHFSDGLEGDLRCLPCILTLEDSKSIWGRYLTKYQIEY
jgi:hypothetical protein